MLSVVSNPRYLELSEMDEDTDHPAKGPTWTADIRGVRGHVDSSVVVNINL